MNPATPPLHVMPLPHSTPIRADSSTMFPFMTTQKYCMESYTTIAREMRKYILGPMPPQQFLDNFFPLSGIADLSDVPHFSTGCYSQTLLAKNELQMYNPFVSPSNGSLGVRFLTIVIIRSWQQVPSHLASKWSIHLHLLIVTRG